MAAVEYGPHECALVADGTDETSHLVIQQRAGDRAGRSIPAAHIGGQYRLVHAVGFARVAGHGSLRLLRTVPRKLQKHEIALVGLFRQFLHGSDDRGPRRLGLAYRAPQLRDLKAPICEQAAHQDDVVVGALELIGFRQKFVMGCPDEERQLVRLGSRGVGSTGDNRQRQNDGQSGCAYPA